MPSSLLLAWVWPEILKKFLMQEVGVNFSLVYLDSGTLYVAISIQVLSDCLIRVY